MSRLFKHFVLGLSCASLLTVGGALARGDSTTSSTPSTAPTAATGTITGTVTGVNGATAGVTVKVFQLPGSGAAPAATTTTGKHHKHLTAVGMPVTTLSDGSFSIPNISPGNYIVVAVLKGVGKGHAKVDLTGTTASVTITLKNHKAKSQ
jgi:hypothetical protein